MLEKFLSIEASISKLDEEIKIKNDEIDELNKSIIQSDICINRLCNVCILLSAGIIVLAVYQFINWYFS